MMRIAPYLSFLAAPLFGALLASCGEGPAFGDDSFVRQNGQKMVGLTQAELVQCAGIPARTLNVSGDEYFVYVASYGGSGTMSVPGAGGISTGGSFAGPSCESQFRIQNGRIVAASYRGTNGPAAWGSATNPHWCFHTIRSCIPRS
jgi:hypothetical protein